MSRGTVAVVLHSYASGWQGAENLPDPPVEGAIEWLERISQEFDVALFSTRAATEAGRQGVRNWLKAHGLSQRVLDSIRIEADKPPALIYLDDRGWRFTGANWPTIHDVYLAKPWWKEPRAEPKPDPAGLRWRVGRKVTKNVYAQLGPEPSDADLDIGRFDSESLAAEACRAHNALLAQLEMPRSGANT